MNRDKKKIADTIRSMRMSECELRLNVQEADIFLKVLDETRMSVGSGEPKQAVVRAVIDLLMQGIDIRDINAILLCVISSNTTMIQNNKRALSALRQWTNRDCTVFYGGIANKEFFEEIEVRLIVAL